MIGVMRDNQGFDILINGVPRTFRDAKESTYEATSVIALSTLL
jgi:hypothetical protein